jgi:putative nucleotidyltransferase with HDIG domain
MLTENPRRLPNDPVAGRAGRFAPPAAKFPTEEDALRALRALPPFSAVAVHLLKLVAQEGIPFRTLADTLRSDAPLSAATLRIANSALFGPRLPVTGVLHAIAMLGLDRVRSMVTTAALKSFTSAGRGTAAVVRCWRHNLACALICEEIARKARLERDFAYTAGILHDIGRLAMMRAWMPRYSALLDSANADTSAQLDLEFREFGIRHTRAGSMLLREWKLPVVFAEIANHHHDPLVQEQADVASLVAFACSLATAVGFGVSPAHAAGGAGTESIRHPVFTDIVAGMMDDLGIRLAERVNELECCLA